MANAEAAAAAMEAGSPLHIEVVFCPGPGAAQQAVLQLPAGSCVADALRECAFAAPMAAAVIDGALSVGRWGRLCGIDQPLRDGDRVELYRPLRVDPKDARRQRQRPTLKQQRQQRLSGNLRR